VSQILPDARTVKNNARCVLSTKKYRLINVAPVNKIGNLVFFQQKKNQTKQTVKRLFSVDTLRRKEYQVLSTKWENNLCLAFLWNYKRNEEYETPNEKK